jgi:hypothetical protein
MSISAVSIQITLEVTNTNDPILRYLGYAFDQPLPALFWNQRNYVVGIVLGTGDRAQSPVITVPVGTHYIVFGSSSDNSKGYWMDIRATVQIRTGGVYGPSISTTQRVHRSQYGYIAFQITATGGLTKIREGTVPPGQAPPVTPSTSGSGGQSTSGAGGGGGSTTTPQIDIGPIINQMMNNIVPPMISMMGMMMMMQMMMGIMQSMAGALAGGF